MKGQWFLISAVVASGAFLAIATLFNSYFRTDSTYIAKINEDYYFRNIQEQLQRTVALSGDCTALEKNYNEFRDLSEDRMAKLGYFLFMNKTDSCSPTFGVLLASERALFYKNVVPEDIIGT